METRYARPLLGVGTIMFGRALLVTMLLSSASVVQASDKPLYQPVPDWVKLAPAPDTKSLTADSPATLIADAQVRLGDGMSWSYFEQATRANSVQALSQAGTISLSWQPAHGDLIIHGVDIIRDGERIDALKGKQFTVLRREQGLERMSMDGMLTATLAVEGLREGDILDVRASRTVKDPSLMGNSMGNAPLLAQPVKIGFSRARLLWPQKSAVQWRAYLTGADPVVGDANGWHELVFAQPFPRQPDIAPQAPGRYARPGFVEASTFADWPSVSKVAVTLYKTDGLIPAGSPLAAEVARIAAAEKDPRHRVAAALALVQGKVRYLFNGMNNGNYVPQKPAETWSLRYGDCKAKTLLLLAMLHELGIEAEPALANMEGGDMVSRRLPSFAAFNHIFVVATVGGEKLWLDGTGAGTQYEDLGDSLPFRWVLPLRAEGAQLVEMPSRAPARPEMEATLNIDQRGGLNIAAPADIRMTFRGGVAGQIKTLASGLDKQKLRELFGHVAPRVGEDRIVLTDSNVTFDDAAGTATVALSGIANPSWNYAQRRYSDQTENFSNLRLPDRSREAWKDVPVATGNPSHALLTYSVRLPGDGQGFEIEGPATLDAALPGGRVKTTTTLAGPLLTVRTERLTSGAEIAPADFPAERTRLAELRNKRMMVRTQPGYPGPWRGIEAARRAHLYDTVLQRYASLIAERPDDPERYAARAQFQSHILDRPQALADWNKAIAIQASAPYLFDRANVHLALGDRAAAIADLKAARDLDPGNIGYLQRLGLVMARAGQGDAALAMIEPQVEEGGENLTGVLMAKAEVLAAAGKGDAALAAIDQAMEREPDNGRLLNERCWTAGTLNFGLETALANCNRAIEMGGQISAMALDSRAMVYFRQNDQVRALTDLNAALDQRPESAESLFMRGVVLTRLGKASEAAADLRDARLLDPQVDATYARWGIKP